MTGLTQREQQAEAERSEMSEYAARLAAERDVMAQQALALAEDEEVQATRIADEEATLAGFADAHAGTDARVIERRQEIAAAKAEIASAEAKLGGFERRQAEMGLRLEKVQLEVESLDLARIEHAARAAELARSIDDLRAGRVTTAAEKMRLEARLGELKEIIQAQERALEETKGELSKKRSRRAALEEMHTRLEGVGAGTKALMGTRDACVAGLVADRVEAPAELTHALAGLLGARLQDVVVHDIERGAELLDALAEGRRGRATIVPLHPAFVAGAQAELPADDGIVGRLADALRFAPEDEALVRALVGDAIVVRDRACAGRLRVATATAALVTLDGTVLYPDGRVAGGQGDEVAAGILDGKRESRELAEAIEHLDEQATHRLHALQASRAEIAQTGTALDKARQEAHQRDLALVTAEKDLQKSETQLESVQRRLEALASEREELGRAIAEAGFERDEVARVLGEAQERDVRAQADLVEAEGTLAEARERLDAQRQVVTGCKVAVAGTREKLAAARGTEARLARSAEELDDRARRLEEEMLTNARVFGETAAQLVSHRELLAVAFDGAREAQETLAGVRAEFEQLRAGLLEREGELKDLRARVDAVREELTTHEMALREKELALGHLVGGVADKFRGLVLPRVVGDYHMRLPPDEELRSRVEELARLLERMGSVNLDAMREHAEAEERFTFYTTQKADLEKALADLTRAIQQMNRESRRLFEETFHLVNDRFREIFPRMFRGGRAELRLTNPEDLLETGIDIVAQPPGKKLSSIELMSGGEKALTAVSLIFAIFQIKPSPFCILDEVDAPLDEANVARYNELVRSMTDRSQFILITHVKRTMQLVDVLYGVTMPEAGVSKIVSVKINESQMHRGATTSPMAAAVA
jgi:chromosome segregation protein